VRQAFGHVVITSTDEETGEVAMGFRAQVPTGLGWIGEHVLTLLVLLPLGVVLLAGIARLAGRRDDPFVRRASIAVAVVDLLLALWACRHFAPDVGRSDGNDGFQLVERAVWVRTAGAEWYLGVDGTSMPLVLLATVVALVAVLVAELERRGDGYHASLALLTAGVIGALVALDLVVLFAAWQTIALAGVLLVAEFGGGRGLHAAAKAATFGAIGLAAMLVAFAALSHASARTFLVDGAPIAHTMAIPELARTSFAAKPPVLGVPFVEVVWVLLFIAVAVATPVVPLHGWLPDLLEEGPAAATIIFAAIVVALGPYLLVRVGLGAMPEGARWGGASIAALGAISSVWGALCALAQRDLRRFVAYATIASAGMCLYGIGALTPQGIAGAVTGLFSHGLAAAMLLTFAAALEQRVRTCDATRIAGLATETPALATLAGIALGVSLGVPGLVGSWAVLLALLGGFVRYPVLALLVAAALVVSAAAHLRIARLVLLGRLDPAWRRSPYLEPFGGRIPDATGREALVLVPLAMLSLLLGVWPTPLLSSIAVAARDAGAAVDPGGPDPEGSDKRGN
jgi:NADH-quinone oxidoreductase subunit M